MCANRASQDAKLEGLYLPVCLMDSLRITVTLAVAFSLNLSLIDIVNTYQNTILTKDQMSYIYPPPFYVE